MKTSRLSPTRRVISSRRDRIRWQEVHRRRTLSMETSLLHFQQCGHVLISTLIRRCTPRPGMIRACRASIQGNYRRMEVIAANSLSRVVACKEPTLVSKPETTTKVDRVADFLPTMKGQETLLLITRKSVVMDNDAIGTKALGIKMMKMSSTNSSIRFKRRLSKGRACVITFRTTQRFRPPLTGRGN